MREQNTIIHDQMMKQTDPNNSLLFIASKIWVRRFKKKEIVSCKITHKVSKRYVTDVGPQAKAEEFVTNIRHFIGEHNFTPERINPV